MVKDMAAIVAAAAPNRGIGYQGQLPWNLPGDMAHFKRVTTESPFPDKLNAVVMGRKTWESIPPKFRPLKDRVNVVLTQQADYKCGKDDDNVIVVNSLDQACQLLSDRNDIAKVFVIGGAQIYKEAMEQGKVNEVIYTEIENLPTDTKIDTYFPDLSETKWKKEPYYTDDYEKPPLVDEKSGLSYSFYKYTRIEPASVRNTEELQYLDMCRRIINEGVKRGDRTGTGTLSIFGTQMRFSLRDNKLPLITTKRTFWRGVAEELLWFISGNTNANDLAAKDIHIWDGNGSREFLDSRGLSNRKVGDLGPVYGFQWRHFGAEYKDMHTDYTGKGVDQLADCINKIINNPEDRRIIMSAWNPADLELMALPPCHMFCQFYVDTTKNEVSCHMYQRSADMGLGVPFNIASYALLTHLIAHVTGRKAGEFIHSIGDAHVYLNHVDALKEQLEREPREFPTLSINPDKKNIDDIEYADLKIEGYNPHKAITMKMAV